MIPYTNPFPGYADFVIAFLVLYLFFYIFSLVVFYYYQKKDLRLKGRDFGLIVFTTIYIPVCIITGPLRDALGRDTFNCDAVLWFRLLCVPMGQIPMNLRLLKEYAKYDLNSAVAAAKLKTMALAGEENDYHHENNNKPGTVISTTISPTTENSSPKPPETPKSVTTSVTDSPIRRIDSLKQTAKSIFGSSNDDVGDDSTVVTGVNSIGEIRKKKYRTSKQVTLLFIIIGMAPFLAIVGIMYAIYPYYGKGCTGCQLGVLEYVLINLGGWSLAPWAIHAAKQMKDVPDPLGHFKEFWMCCYFSIAFSLPAMFMLIADPWTGITAIGIGLLLLEVLLCIFSP